MQKKERELILRILEIEKELGVRLERDKLKGYNNGEKVHKKQIEFHKCLKRNRWVFGGNRSGKTECGAVESIWMARGIHPYRENRKRVDGWIVSVSSGVQRAVAQKKILRYLNPDWIERIVMNDGSADFPEGGVIDTIYVKNISGEISSLTFKTHEQGREKFQGASLDFVWFDEEPPKDIFLECYMRIIDKKGDLFTTMTPLKGLSWVYDEIYLNSNKDDEIWVERMEWADNPFLNKGEIERLTKALSKEELEARRYGRFVPSGGLVYPEFDPSVHVIEPFSIPKEWQAMISIDPGLKNPLSCHFYYVDYDGVIYVVGEHYEGGKDVAYHSEKIKELARSLDWQFRSDGRLEVLIDSASNQRTLASIKSVTELFYDNGILCNTQVDKDTFSGISKVRELFRTKPPRIYIFSNCVNMIRELKGYSWGRGESPVKRDDHAMDELRYFVMAKYHQEEPKEKKTRMQKHKECLIRSVECGIYKQ